MVLLAVDLGTSSCRACLLREDGRILGESREPVAPTRAAGGVVEMDPDAALEIVIRTTAAAIKASAGAIPDGVGLSSMLGWVFVDREGAPLRTAITWEDHRTIQEAGDLASSIGRDAFYRITGRRLSPDLLLPKLPWLRKHEGTTSRRLAAVLGLKDYLVARFTGSVGMDPATASYTGAFDVQRGTEDAGLLGAAGGRPGLLPPVQAATGIAGRASGELADRAGLPRGVPFIRGSVDGTTAMYGSGVLLPGVASLVSGTTDVLMVSTRSKPLDPSMILTVNPANDGGFLVGGATGISGGALEYFASLLCTKPGDCEESIAALAQDPRAPFCLPGLTGERSPYWEPRLRGAIVDLGLPHGRADVLRAVMEGCCFRLASLLEQLGRLGLRPNRIVVSGGGSRSASWNRLRADSTGLAVQRAVREEATIVGTSLFLEAALAGQGLRELSLLRLRVGEQWQPDPARVEVSRARRRRFEALLASEAGTANGRFP